jgi:hypothetical protein
VIKKLELWKAEFGKNYNVPAIIAKAEGVEDISWHNDICPSFVWAVLDRGPEGEEHPLRLWVEHPDPHQREGGPEADRFFITAGMDCDEIYTGNDAAEAMRRFIEERDKRLPGAEPAACLTCDNGRQMPEDANLLMTMEGHSVQVYCRACGRCLQA